MKILLVTTGGTIASIIDDGVIDVTPQGRLLVLRKYREIDPSVQFEVISPVNILSENIRTQDYKTIVSAFMQIDFEEYDGVIVTHGSDTLAYTSALFGLLFSEVSKPITIVAADKSLQDAKSNGMDNFIAAVEIIKTQKNGVFVPYRNADMVTYIHVATKLLESSVLSDDFYSVCGACGMYKDGEVTFFDGDYKIEKAININDADLSFSKKIIQIMPYPDLDYSRIDISAADAVIHRTYHAGSVCVDSDENTSVVPFIKRCEDMKIPFYVCGLKEGKDNYFSMSSVLSLCVKPLYDMSPACAYMKLMLEG